MESVRNKEPKLIGHVPIPRRVPILAAVVLMSFGYWVAGWAPEEAAGTPENKTDVPPLIFTMQEAPGIVRIIDENWPVAHHVEAMKLKISEIHKLKKQIKNKELNVGRLVVWDTVDEDLDVISIASAGYSQEYPLSHEAKTLYLPVNPGGNVVITAKRDGGGGVTLGARTIAGPVMLPRLEVGESIQIPVM